MQAALDSAVQSDKAPAIFEGAADKFQEVSAHGEALKSACLRVSSRNPGMLNWHWMLLESACCCWRAFVHGALS